MREQGVCLQRPYNGIGDWLMALACLKMAQRQRPEIPLYADYAKARALPALVPQAFGDSDVRIEPGHAPARARVTRDSLVYRKRPPENYIESMLLHLNDQTGLGIEYEHRLFPRFRAARRPGRYLVMVGQGKRRERHRKEWGSSNLQQLAQILGRHYEIRQIGGRWDAQLPGTTLSLRGAHFNQVRDQLAGARAFIGLENGMMILAGFLGIPQVTIYDGHSDPIRSDFDNHLKIAERIEPPAAAELIRPWIETCS